MKRVILLLALATPAYAQDEAMTEDGRPIRYKQETLVDFNDVNVDATLVKPSFGLVSERRQAQFNKLIKVRTDFNDTMEASVGEAK